MKIWIKILFAFIWLTPPMLFAAGEIYRPASVTPPEPLREFRGAWLATAANIDWPSKPGLTVAEQKTELTALLDRAAELKLNAVLFQVRPACDTLYASPLEPWSEYLTGTQGRAPEPLYDPLAFAIAEAHKRGLELHAWFNPFRARLVEAKSPAGMNHISRLHPELVRQYGGQLWLDPGEPGAREFVLRVVMDVVQRYDVDGVAFDDYFYPYPEKDSAGHELDFPDDASWQKFGLESGLTRDNWRRANINSFIYRVYQSIKAAKAWVKFGVSPFGIWRPGFPERVQGLDAYAKLYADSRGWLASGWLDYFVPQLYWTVDSPQQSFPILLNWWSAQNVKGRNLWVGLNASAVGEKWKPDEIARQIKIARESRGVSGEIFYHLRNLEANPALAEVIRTQYAQSALVPASPWMAVPPSDQPNLVVTSNYRSSVSLRWETSGSEPPRLWILQFRATNNVWTTEILPADETNRVFESSSPQVISIRMVDRVGNLSEPFVLALQENEPVRPVHAGLSH